MLHTFFGKFGQVTSAPLMTDEADQNLFCVPYLRGVLIETGEHELRVPFVDAADAAAAVDGTAAAAAPHIEAVEAVGH